MSLTIRVPATSANIGLGFDCLGLAIQRYTYFTVEASDYLVIEGCPDEFANEKNLVFQSFLKSLEFLNIEPFPIHLTIDSHVPISRGLGSSATCVVGGVLAAFALTNQAIDKDKILAICTEIEGHPDNVAPAIFGGLIASAMLEDEIVYVEYPIHADYHFMTLIPDFPTETKEARKVLPETLPFQTAVQNTGKLAVFLKVLELYQPDSLRKLLTDEFHEPYRKEIIHEFEQVKDICQQIDSSGFYISGSGSTLMNILENPDSVTLIQKKLENLTHQWQAELAKIDYEGAIVC